MAEKMSKTVVVHRPISECFNLWSNFENFPNFMEHIKEVHKLGERESHWVMEGPMGKQVEWRARTTTMEPNRRIAWSSYEGDVDTNGEVNFRDLGNNETEITVVMAYAAKGALSDFIAKYFTNTGDWLEEDLRNFKRYTEQAGTRAPERGSEVGGRTYAGRSEYAPDAEEEMPNPRTTGTYRERTGAGAMGSTPGGPTTTPTGGTIGDTTRGTGSSDLTGDRTKEGERDRSGKSSSERDRDMKDRDRNRGGENL